MSARILNESSYPTKTVERLIHGALRDLDVDVNSLTVRVVDAPVNKWAKKQYASGYWEFLGGAFGHARILIRLPKRGHPIGDYHPYERKREQGRSFPLADWKEALVAVAAHEGEHHRQRWVAGEKRGTRPRKNRRGEILRPGTGHRRVDVELRCDLAAYRAWRRYRESRKLPVDI